MQKRKSKGKDIVARSISLVDSKGKTRIYMGVNDKPAYSSICLFGERDRAIEISADHEGGLHISLRDGTGQLVAGLGITSDDQVGINLFDHRSGNRTELGSDGTGGPPHITLHHRGRKYWDTRKGTGTKEVR